MGAQEELLLQRKILQERIDSGKASDEQVAAAKSRIKDIDVFLPKPERQAKVETTEARSAPEKAVTRGKAK